MVHLFYSDTGHDPDGQWQCVLAVSHGVSQLSSLSLLQSPGSSLQPWLGPPSLAFLPLCFYVQNHPHITFLSLCFQRTSDGVTALTGWTYILLTIFGGCRGRKGEGRKRCMCVHAHLMFCSYTWTFFKYQLWIWSYSPISSFWKGVPALCLYPPIFLSPAVTFQYLLVFFLQTEIAFNILLSFDFCLNVRCYLLTTYCQQGSPTCTHSLTALLKHATCQVYRSVCLVYYILTDC